MGLGSGRQPEPRDRPIEMVWEAPDPEAVHRLLAAVGLVEAAPGVFAATGLRLAVVRTPGPGRIRPAAGGTVEAPPGPPDGSRLVALGVATVDLERATVAYGRAADLPPDELLGARVSGTADPRVVALEPAREGRLAATLARHGEGPAVLYLTGGHEPPRGVRLRAGRGPFGPQRLVLAAPSGPHLVLVSSGRGSHPRVSGT